MCDINMEMGLLSQVLFNKPFLYGSISEECTDSLLEDLEKQAVLPLLLPVLPLLNLSDTQRALWMQKTLKRITRNVQIMHAEKNLIELLNRNGIASLILKGTSFAQYYPDPSLRIRGDIDLLVNEIDYEKAAVLLINEGFKTRGINPGRHTELFKDGIEVELHRYFSDADAQSAFFNLSKMTTTPDGIPCFTPVENGISMLLHIKYHIGAIGLRHYIDWIMYVKEVCNDLYWTQQLKSYAEKYDLVVLAKALTKAGKRFFPLDGITWCDDVDNSFCDDLLAEFYKSGNFNQNLPRQKAITITTSKKGLAFWIKLIATRGVNNWKPAQKYKILIPIAFLRQCFCYLYWYIKEYGLNCKELWEDRKRRKHIDEVLHRQ